MALLEEWVLRVFSESFGASLWNNFIVTGIGEAKKAPTKHQQRLGLGYKHGILVNSSGRGVCILR
ncbi:hypothetical protein Q2E61_10305 [Microbulbifer thermotolerans]|nr:hypothetical protein [Microbulbifer thermotolerans]MCX2841858.1 hypothetical protein [Microbulbifer thermotolerans]WKT59307.1 hypothetical protein Q2E61_10305 [Microbulbifer thermotolerans]